MIFHNEETYLDLTETKDIINDDPLKYLETVKYIRDAYFNYYFLEEDIKKHCELKKDYASNKPKKKIDTKKVLKYEKKLNREDYYSLNELVGLMGINVRSVYNYLSVRNLYFKKKYMRVGQCARVFFYKSEIDKFIEKRQKIIDKYYTATETAQILGISRSNFKRRRQRGHIKLKSYRFNILSSKTKYFKRADVHAELKKEKKNEKRSCNNR